jgi:hypothetical protein
MKTISIETEARPLSEWLPQEDSEEVIYLTRNGRTRFVVVPLDEGDEEVLAIQKNNQLMAYVADSVQHARKGPTKSLAQIRAEFGLAAEDLNGPPS